MPTKLAFFGSALLLFSLGTSIPSQAFDTENCDLDSPLPCSDHGKLKRDPENLGDTDGKKTSTWWTSRTHTSPDIVVSTKFKEIVKTSTIKSKEPSPVTKTVISTVTVTEKKEHEPTETVTQIIPQPSTCRSTLFNALNQCLDDTKYECEEHDWECECRGSQAQEKCFDVCPKDERHIDYEMMSHEACRHLDQETQPLPFEPTNTRVTYLPVVYQTKQRFREIYPHSTTMKSRSQTSITVKYPQTVIDYPGHHRVTAWTDDNGHTHTPTIRRMYNDEQHTFQTLNARPNPTPTGAALKLDVDSMALMVGALGVVAAAL